MYGLAMHLLAEMWSTAVRYWMIVAACDVALTLLVPIGGMVARYRHRLTCRAYWQWMMIYEVISTLTSLVVWAAWVGTGVFFQTFTGLWLVGEGCEIKYPVMRRFVIKLEFVEPVKVTLRWGGMTATFCEMRRHWSHDDDCEFGPTKRWSESFQPRLAGWRKISLNPAFAPS